MLIDFWCLDNFAIDKRVYLFYKTLSIAGIRLFHVCHMRGPPLSCVISLTSTGIITVAHRDSETSKRKHIMTGLLQEMSSAQLQNVKGKK